MNYLNTLLFGLYPYIALFICFIASWIRYDREQYTWKASSSQLLEGKQLKPVAVYFTWVSSPSYSVTLLDC